MRTISSSSPSTGSAPQCLYCGRSLDGYEWKFADGSDGYICPATHKETEGNVALMKYHLSGDEWVLAPKET